MAAIRHVLFYDPQLPILVDLIENNLCSITVRDNNGYILVHHAIANEAPLSVISLLVKETPKEELQSCPRGMNLLHYAMYVKASLAIVKFICRLYPACIGGRDVFGRLPIHIACKHYAVSTKVVCLLLDLCPESIVVRFLFIMLANMPATM